MPQSDLPRRTAAVLLLSLVLQASGLPTLSVAATAAPKRSRADPGPRALLEQGKELLADLQFEAAASALKKGIDGLISTPEDLDFDALLDGYVSLAVASFRMGDEDGAQAALLAVARLAPAFQLPDGKFPPIFMREFERARRRAEKLPKGSVKVEGPAGATVFVDGRHVGQVPVIAENLAVGRHFVKVQGTRGELFAAVVDLTGGAQQVQAVFTADTAELVPTRKSSLVTTPVAADSRVAALSGTHLPADALRPDPMGEGASAEVRQGAGWWVWALVGVGVAAAAGGAYYGVTEASRPVTGTVTARW